MNQSYAQNLLLNGDFEETQLLTSPEYLRKDSFYATYWLRPTDCTPDIFRSSLKCDSLQIKSYEPILDFCVPVKSGNYCAGIGIMDKYGSMEHLTGQLSNKLEPGKVYKISFWLKFPGGAGNYLSPGFGYKFSEDSILFTSTEQDLSGLSPYYYYLFKDECVYGDYQVEFYQDTSWKEFTSFYSAKGNERFITFGKFCTKEENRAHLIKFFHKSRSKPGNTEKYLRQMNLDTYFIPTNNIGDNRGVMINYYFLDNITVEELKGQSLLHARTQCTNCIDNDPMTINIPHELVFDFDRGFEGELSFELGFSLKENEYIELIMEKGTRLLFIPSQPILHQQILKFKYPAKKIRGGKIYYRVRSFLSDSLNELNMIHEAKDYKIYSTKKIGHFELESIN